MSNKKITILALSLNFPLIRENSRYSWGKGAGGAENQLLLLGKNLVKRKTLQVYVLSKRFNLKEESHLKIENWNLIRIYAPNKFFLFYYLISSFLSILKLHQRERINLIHINEPSISLPLAVILKKLFNIPVFQKFPSIFTKSLLSDNYYRHAQPFLLKLTKRFDKIQCISTQIYNSALELGFKPETLVKIPNGIDTKPYETIIRETHQKITKLLFIGRLAREKGIIMLVEVFHEVLLQFPDISLSIFGRGPETGAIQKMIKTLNLEEKIQISSYDREAEKLSILQDHDLFILPSFFEGLSNALLEALCSGMPVLVSNTKSNRELIINGENGVLFANRSKNSLKEKIIYCLTHPEQLRKIGTNGMNYCRKNFDIDVIEKKVFQNYIDLIRKSGEFH